MNTKKHTSPTEVKTKTPARNPLVSVPSTATVRRSRVKKTAPSNKLLVTVALALFLMQGATLASVLWVMWGMTEAAIQPPVSLAQAVSAAPYQAGALGAASDAEKEPTDGTSTTQQADARPGPAQDSLPPPATAPETAGTLPDPVPVSPPASSGDASGPSEPVAAVPAAVTEEVRPAAAVAEKKTSKAKTTRPASKEKKQTSRRED